jgi:cytochrome c-type biogenesis protein CcmH/NrfF
VLRTIPWLWNYLLAPALSLWAVPVLFVLSMALFWSARAAAARRRKHH